MLEASNGAEPGVRQCTAATWDTCVTVCKMGLPDRSVRGSRRAREHGIHQGHRVEGVSLNPENRGLHQGEWSEVEEVSSRTRRPHCRSWWGAQSAWPSAPALRGVHVHLDAVVRVVHHACAAHPHRRLERHHSVTFRSPEVSSASHSCDKEIETYGMPRLECHMRKPASVHVPVTLCRK